MKTRISLFTLLVTLVYGEYTDPKADTSTLKSVQLVFRHGQKIRDAKVGDRTGLLKDEGKLQMFELGTYSRHRYGDFINLNYDANEVQIITSGAKRCIQSGSMFAYGLYQNFSRSATWNPDDPHAFEPIPVEPIPSQIDKWLQLTAPCPRKKQLDDSFLDQSHIEIYEANKDFFNAYVQNTGDAELYNEASEVPMFQRVFPGISYFDPSVPKPPGDWYQPFMNRNLYNDMKYRYNDLFYNSTDLRQMATGPFFEMLYNRTELSRNPLKLYAYATHDFSITALTVLFGQNLRDFAPDHPTATTYFLEVHQQPGDSSAEPHLRVFYRNSTTAPIRQFQVKGCGEPCYLSKFKELVHKWVPENYEEMCRLTGKDPRIIVPADESSTSSVTVPIVLIVSMILIGGVVAVYLIRRNRNRRPYQQPC